jgi:hypothetical protein
MKKLNYTVFTIFIFCFSLFIFSFFRSFDPDLWGHLKFGEYIIAHQAIPSQDVFSFVPTKELWINHEWLCEVIFAALLKLNKAGFFLLFFKALAFTAIIIFIWLYTTANKSHIVIHFILYIIIIMALSHGSAIRPHIFTYVFYALLLFILEKDQLKTKLSFITLPLLFIIWVNTHGGVLAGLAVVTFFALYRVFYLYTQKNKTHPKMEYITLLLIPVILTLVLIINPYTWHYYPYIIDAAMMKRPFVEEWQSVFSASGNFIYFFMLAALVIILPLVNIKKLTTENFYRLLFLIIFMLASFKHSRHVPFFAITCAFYLPYFIQFSLENIKKLEVNKAINVIIISIIGFLSIILFFVTFFKDNKFYYILEVKTKTTPQYVGYPVNTVQYIQHKNLKGNMMNNFNWGEFFIFNLYPEVLVSFDGRYETVYPHSVVEDNLTFLNGEEGWHNILKKYNPDMVVVSKADPVSKRMYQESGWPLIFVDHEALLFVNPSKPDDQSND